MDVSHDRYRCVNRVLVSKSCAPGLMWNEKDTTCDFASNVDCAESGGSSGGAGSAPGVSLPPQGQSPPGIPGGGESTPPPQIPGIPQRPPGRAPLHPGLDEVGEDFVVVENPALRSERDSILTSYDGAACTAEINYKRDPSDCSAYTV